MPLPLIADIGRALEALEGERRSPDRQIVVLQPSPNAEGHDAAHHSREAGPQTIAPMKPRGMSPVAREAVRQRMKAYWAKRKAEAAKRPRQAKA